MAGLQEADSGRLTKQGGADGIRIGMLSQEDDLDPEWTIREAVLGDLPEHVWAGDPRVRDVLTGLLGGIEAQNVGGLDSRVGPKSGGERRRLALARLLVSDPELLLLDEPTNHLDVEGVAWLADHLATKRPRPGNATVAITHDRWFLDAYATMTWEVESGKVSAFEGGYAAYVLAKAERDRLAGVVADRRSNLMRKELAWLRRGPPARTSKPKFRIDAANALIADEPAPRNSVELASFASRRLGKDVLDLEDVTVSVGEPPHERRLLDHVTWRLAPGERIGIVGVNGAGKSTLLRALTGETPLDAGRRKIGKTVAIAHLTQEVRELERFEQWRVIEAIEDVKQWTTLGDKEISASQLATRLGFPGGRQQSRVGDLSGGERRRLQLTRLLLTEPNVLILDEPTNDLDIETLTSLEDVLDGWAGTLVVVSHDRYLLERVADKQLALLGDGKVRDLPGGVEEYLRLRAAAVASRDRVASRPSRVGDRARVVRPAGRHTCCVHLGGEPGRGARGSQDHGPHREAALAAAGPRGADPRRHGREARPTRPRWPTSTRSSRPWSANARTSSSSGSRPPRSSADAGSRTRLLRNTPAISQRTGIASWCVAVYSVCCGCRAVPGLSGCRPR